MKNRNQNKSERRSFIFYALFLSAAFLISSFYSCSGSKSVFQNSTTFYFVRHAEKAKDGTRDPDLTEAGKIRAGRLAALLKSDKISAVYSTDYKRTRQTAEPTASLFNLNIEIYDHKSIDINELANSMHGKSVLVVGHSNSTPQLTNKLIGVDRFKNFADTDYDNILKVTIKKREKTVEHLRYN